MYHKTKIYKLNLGADMISSNYGFINLFINKDKLVHLIKPNLSTKLPCFAPIEHHLFDRIWVLKTYKEIYRMLISIKETQGNTEKSTIKKRVITYEDQIAIERYLSIKFTDLCNILLTSFYDIFNAIKLTICFNDFLLENDSISCIWIIIRILEILLSIYPSATMNILSFEDLAFNADTFYIKSCYMILLNPKMENIQISFNSIQFNGSFYYSNKEYIINERLREACDNNNILEIAEILKELSDFKNKKKLVSEKVDIEIKDEKINEGNEENKPQFKLPRWLYEKVFNGSRKETKPQKFQSYHAFNAKMINHQVRVAQFLELNKKLNGRVDPKFQRIPEIELKIQKSSLRNPKKLLGLKISRNHEFLILSQN